MSAALVLRTLQRLEHGRIEVALPGGERRAFGASDSARADLEVRSRAAFSRILRAGDIGFAEGYLEAEWTTSDLPRLLTLLAHPFMTIAVMARIHWQALRLWLKRAPFFAKPPAHAEELSQ